jgi:hypothetical protein
MLVIHPNVDLDACLCVALADVPLDSVFFLSASAAELPASLQPSRGQQPVRLLDHPLGEKGRLDADGRRHAAALSMPEASDLQGTDLLAEADEQDSTGRVLTPRFSLSAILSAVRSQMLSQGHKDEALDRAILDVMVPVLRGLVGLERRRRQQLRVLDSIPIVQVGSFRLAVLDNVPDASGLGIMLNESGVAGAVYRDGLNLGVTRYPGHAAPDLRLLSSRLPGWFVHTAGFLAAWGSRKAPATTLPPPGTPQTPQELIDVLQRVFG